MYNLPNLPYDYQDLEPYIDTHTLGLHYHKHQQGYLDKLNELLNDENYDYSYNINDLVFHINEFSINNKEDILFNLGGVINHNLYFNSMNTKEKRKMPYGKLLTKINNQYGSVEKLFSIIKENALRVKGSGYTFLVVNKDMNLEVINTSNQDMPLFYGYYPLFAIDVWEHAYYINYENERGRYLDNFFIISDFSNASNLYNNL